MHTARTAALLQASSLKSAILLSPSSKNHQDGAMFHAQDIDFS